MLCMKDREERSQTLKNGSDRSDRSDLFDLEFPNSDTLKEISLFKK